jgi:hypothetical protein
MFAHTDSLEKVKRRVIQTKQTISRMHWIIKLGVVMCIILVIAVGIMAILIIS